MFVISLNSAAYVLEPLGKDIDELHFTCRKEAAGRTGPLG
jgi:hypothetical protein